MIEIPPTVNHIDLNKFQNNKNISISEVRFKHYFNIKFDRNIIYDNKSKLEVDGLIIPNINKGNPTQSVHILKKWPPIAGRIQPIRIGNPNPIRSPNSRNCFLLIVFFII